MLGAQCAPVTTGLADSVFRQSVYHSFETNIFGGFASGFGILPATPKLGSVQGFTLPGSTISSPLLPLCRLPESEQRPLGA